MVSGGAIATGLGLGGMGSTRSFDSYRSNIAPRTTSLQRSTVGPSMMTRISHTFTSAGGAGAIPYGSFGMHGGAQSAAFGLSSLGAFGMTGVPMRPSVGYGGNALVAVNETRLREKHQLSQLNDKFAQYVEKIRFLEAQNKKLDLELKALRSKEGQGGSRIREMYDIEIKAAKDLIDMANRDKVVADQQLKEAEANVDNLRIRYEQTKNLQTDNDKKIEALENEIARNEAQINLLRRRYDDLQEEAARYKNQIQRIINEINNVTNDIYQEQIMKSHLEAEKMGLEDEIHQMNEMHQLQVKEIRDRSTIDSGLEPSQFFRNELAEAINQIRQEYEMATEQQRNEMHNQFMMQYNMIVMKHRRPDMRPAQTEQQRVHEEKLRTTLITSRNDIGQLKARNEDLSARIRDLTARLKMEQDDDDRALIQKDQHIKELQIELEQLQAEYDRVINTKISLQDEINEYKNLLEGSSNQEGLRQIVEHVEEEARRLEAEKLTENLASPSGYAGTSVAGSGRIRGSSGLSSTSYQTISYSSGPVGGFGMPMGSTFPSRGLAVGMRSNLGGAGSSYSAGSAYSSTGSASGRSIGGGVASGFETQPLGIHEGLHDSGRGSMGASYGTTGSSSSYQYRQTGGF